MNEANLQDTKISIVSPVFNGANLIEELVTQIKDVLKDSTESFEIVLVDDGSPDRSWDLISEQCKKDSRIKGVKLSRNFGQHYAITAGLKESKGEFIVVMDCDLQDDPKEILKLYNKIQEGHDYVQAIRMNRTDSYFRKIFSKVFYHILSLLSGYKIDPRIANFGIYHNKVIKSVLRMPQKIRWFPNLIRWVGFNGASMDVPHAERFSGKSNYSISMLLRISIDVFLINSKRPMLFIAGVGCIISLLSIVYALAIVVMYQMGIITVLGYSSIMISVLFCSGVIIFFLGVIGLYVLKIFEQVQDRPLYIIANKLN